MSDNDTPNIPINTLAQTENYEIWSAQEPDGETTFHVELGPVTAHFFREEWAEFLHMIREAAAQANAESGNGAADDEDDEDDESGAEIELDWGSLSFDDDEWAEFLRLIEGV